MKGVKILYALLICSTINSFAQEYIIDGDLIIPIESTHTLKSSSSCSDWQNYSIEDEAYTPVKTVRIAFHIVDTTGSIKRNFIDEPDTYVQNENITDERIITGNNIFVGYSVTSSKPNGNVVIKNGADVIFDTSENVYIEPGFEVELGGVFEIR